MYATAMKRKQHELKNHIAKRKPREIASSDSESNSDVSVNIIDPPLSQKSLRKSKKRALAEERTKTLVARKKRAQKAESLQEETAYQKKVQ
jgi:hypothetical protein